MHKQLTPNTYKRVLHIKWLYNIWYTDKINTTPYLCELDQMRDVIY